jgi:hypothetical protein
MKEPNKPSVLFISLSFFGYEKDIQKAIADLGYDVDFYDERATNNSFFKAVSRVKKSLVSVVINEYYNKILKQISGKKYAYFFLIKGEAIPEKFIVEFKKLNPAAKLVYYSFDAIANNKNSLKILKYFDSCYSFDFNDVQQYPFFKLKHLFYTKQYINTDNGLKNRLYDISFVGTVHSNRYTTIKHLLSNFEKSFCFLYMPARWLYYINKIKSKRYKKMKLSEVSFSKLSRDEVASIFKSSKSVLDIQRFKQTGLTMRTLEVLASGAILVTTNTFIKQSEFYNENKIVILKSNNFEHQAEEIKKKIVLADIDEAKKFDSEKKYCLSNWVKDFFN